MTADAGLQDGAAILRRIRPQLKKVRVHICLRPDLITEWHRLDSELEESMQEDLTAGQPDGRARLATGSSTETEWSDKTVDLAEQQKRLEPQLEEADVVFTIQAMPKDEWRTHVAKYPPRKDNTFDMICGYNRDEALDAAVRRAVIDPVFPDCPSVHDGTIRCDHTEESECEGASWQGFEATCATSEWEELKTGTQAANEEKADADPKSVRASRVLASSAGSSTSARSSGSRSGRSTGGRRARSSSTSR